MCGRSFREGSQYPTPLDRIRVLAPIYRAGQTRKEGVRVSGYSHHTVSHWWLYFASVFPRTCGCGRPDTHGGSCLYRVELRHGSRAKQVIRQIAMKAWTTRRARTQGVSGARRGSG